MDANFVFSENNLTSSRKAESLCFAKNFDEPFVIDVLNYMHYNNCNYNSTNEYEDRKKHVDIKYTDIEGTIHYTDVKTYTKDYTSSTTKTPTDIINIGEYALENATEYITFVYEHYIYFIHSDDIKNIRPISKIQSKGQNNNIQVLYGYEIKTIITHPTITSTYIPTNLWKCWSYAYQCYMDTHTKIESIWKSKITDEEKINKRKHEIYDILVPNLRKIIACVNNILSTPLPQFYNIEPTITEIHRLLA